MRTQAKLTGKRCQCPTCSEFFSTPSNFDRHRKGKHGINRHCVDPATVGMVIGSRADNTFWRMPSETELLDNKEE
jgi:hypothetical protein